MESFTVQTTRCWIDFLKTSLQAQIDKHEPLDATVKQLLGITSGFFKVRWPVTIELLKHEDKANVSKTRTQSKCRLAYAHSVAPYFQTEFRTLNSIIEQGVSPSFER
jgi:hypothetical protein